jgi:2-alkyl-3-oxoalkanoate reductase
VFDVDALGAAMEEARPEVIVHELTALPDRIDFRKADTYAATNRVRTEGTRNLIDAARTAGARRIVCQSIAFAYRMDGEGLKTENDPLLSEAAGAFGSGVSALREMEAMVLGADGLDGLVLRYGFFYGPGTYYAADGTSTDDVRRRRMPIVGRGSGVFWRSSTWTTPPTPRWRPWSAARRAYTTSPTTSRRR